MAKDALLKSETFQKAYREWIENPITQMVADILREEGRCVLPPAHQVRAENGLVEAAKNIGWFNCLGRMLSLDTQQQIAEEPRATFGAEQMAKELGIKLEQKGTADEQ